MSPPPPIAKALGYAGLIPFVALAMASHGPASLALGALWALAAYAATIASFLGGVHWGLAFVQGSPRPAMFVWGVVPSLLAWAALLLPHAAGLTLLAATLVAALWVDVRVYPRLGLHAWLRLRLHLTAVAMISCIVGAWAA